MQVKAGGIKVLPCEDIDAQRIDISNDEFRINAGGGDACVKVNERNILLTKSCDTPPPPTKWTFTAIGQIEMAGRDLCLVRCDCPTGFDPAEAILVACKKDTEEQKWEVVKK